MRGTRGRCHRCPGVGRACAVTFRGDGTREVGTQVYGAQSKAPVYGNQDGAQQVYGNQDGAQQVYGYGQESEAGRRYNGYYNANEAARRCSAPHRRPSRGTLDPRERRYRARSDLIVAQNGEAEHPGPPLNHNAPVFAPAAPAVVIAAPLDPRARGFVPKAQQQRPSCPNDCVLTPEGMVAARRYNGGATRYYYSCRNCRRSFSQIRPDKLPPGHHRNPKWCKPAAAAPPPTSAPSATPKRHRHGRRHKPREWTLRAGQTQGEVALGFHNSSGKLSDEISRKNWIDALLAKLDIVGVCELGADASVQAEMEAAQRQLRDGYKAVFGLGTRAKSGMALLVSNRLATTTVQD